MSGVVTHLGAFGVNDLNINVDPEITFFRTVIPRHSHFSWDRQSLEFVGTTGYSRAASAEMQRNGDLLSRLWLVMEISQLEAGAGGVRCVNDFARAAIEYVRIKAGGTKYAELQGMWLHIEDELYNCGEKQYGRLTGKSESAQELEELGKRTQKFYVPLTFWFSKDPGMHLPLIATHLTKLWCEVKLRARTYLSKATTAASYTPASGDGDINDMYLLAEYVYVTDDERTWFVNTEHRWTMEQVHAEQPTTIAASSTTANIDLQINHSVKVIHFVLQQATYSESGGDPEHFNFVGQETGKYLNESFATFYLKLNGNNWNTAALDPLFMRAVVGSEFLGKVPNKQIYTVPISMDPKKYGSTGIMNFSRIDTKKIALTFTSALSTACDAHIFAVGINELSLKGGVLQLEFSN